VEDDRDDVALRLEVALAGLVAAIAAARLLRSLLRRRRRTD
jgi:hypothetical protein